MEMESIRLPFNANYLQIYKSEDFPIWLLARFKCLNKVECIDSNIDIYNYQDFDQLSRDCLTFLKEVGKERSKENFPRSLLLKEEEEEKFFKMFLPNIKNFEPLQEYDDFGPVEIGPLEIDKVLPFLLEREWLNENN